MSILPIVTIGDQILRQPTKDVMLPLNDELQTLIDDMIETMNNAEGVGLAAPQIGRSERICIVKTQDADVPLINPTVVSKSMRKHEDEEGCLSIPGTYGIVKRHNKVRTKAFDRKGKPMNVSGEGLLARIIQHEIDHLDGILFVDRTTNITRRDDHPSPSYETR